MTVYYLDYTNGSDSYDGLSTTTAYKTLGKFTYNSSARSPGDILYVRAGNSEQLTTNVVFDEDGTGDSPISVIGCNASQGIDPWSDGSNVRPEFTSIAAAYNVQMEGDEYWSFKNINFTTSTTAASFLYLSYATGFTAENVKISGSLSQNLKMVNCTRDVLLTNCELTGASDYNISVTMCQATFNNCTFNGSPYGFWSDTNSYLVFNKCNIGQTTTPTNVITFNGGGSLGALIYFNNCHAHSSSSFASWGNNVTYNGGEVYVDGVDGVFGTSKTIRFIGTVTKDTDVLHTGGASSSAKLVADGYAAPTKTRPLSINIETQPDFKLWMLPGAQTITVFMRGLNWSTFPTAAQLFLEAEYVTDDTSGAITTTKVVSDEVLTDNTSWVGFQCAVNPHVASFVNVKVKLCYRESTTRGVYVDIKPVIT